MQFTLFIARILAFILRLTGLRGVRFIGGVIGQLTITKSKKTYTRLKSNLMRTKICNADNVTYGAQCVAKEFGATILETFAFIWECNDRYTNIIANQVIGFEQMQLDLQRSLPIILLTPHIGNFDIVLRFTASHINSNMTVLYKKYKNRLVNHIMYHCRKSGNVTLAPTGTSGINQIIRAINNKEVVGILPDHVAPYGSGTAVNFFQQQVYATTLFAKLIMKYPNIQTYMVYSTRTNSGITIEYNKFIFSGSTVESITQELYSNMQAMITRHPYQYYWSYDRFRQVGTKHVT